MNSRMKTFWKDLPVTCLKRVNSRSDPSCHTASAVANSAPLQLSIRDALVETFSSGRRFWERARIAFNVVLALLSIGFFLIRLPESRELLTTDNWLVFALFAIGANILYSAAYLPEFILQAMVPRNFAVPVRFTVFVIGTTCACFLTGFALHSLLLGAAD